ncbi:uncharacterized protein GGS25DRAFT_103034 [Hypoxylon fragiforme]|uniref:uncharacterized protein n=1 Tax=Hypoxylon fragiforme TaxID=63214 RepID=UPI0020C5E066|nr:uncharacterized protein GGS25DRAFT_103034 [Hypoxylon fragiforme]KAI2612031.1 hypothetical protein GGS25DRAFT_103034 [Hypoxylon fragiforme]
MATTTTTFRKTTLSHAQKTVLAMSRAQYLDAIRHARPADKLYVGVCIFRMDTHSSRPSVLLLRRSGSCGSAASSGYTAAEYSDNGNGNNAYYTHTTARTPTSTEFSSSSHWGNGNSQQAKQQPRNSNPGTSAYDMGEVVEGGRRRSYPGDGGGGNGNSSRGRNVNGSGTWELPGGKVRDGDFCISAAVARQVAHQTGLRVARVIGALQDVRRVRQVRILDWDDDGVGIFSTYADLDALDGATLTSFVVGGGGDGDGAGVSSGGTLSGGSRRGSLRGSLRGSRDGSVSGGSIYSGSIYSGSFYGDSIYNNDGGGGGGSWGGRERERERERDRERGRGSIGGGVGTSVLSSSSSWDATAAAARPSPVHSPQLVLRKECLQLNYAVLVKSHDDLRIQSRDHDEMVWASFGRAETLDMPEEIRMVVRQGLAFAAEYLF